MACRSHTIDTNPLTFIWTFIDFFCCSCYRYTNCGTLPLDSCGVHNDDQYICVTRD